MQNQLATILSIQHEDSSISLSLLQSNLEYATPIRNVSRHFRVGDFLRVIAGTSTGVQGFVVEVDDDIWLVIRPEGGSDIAQVKVAVFYVESGSPDHCRHPKHPLSISDPMQRPSTPPEVRLPQMGDSALVCSGPSQGYRAAIQTIDESSVWVLDVSEKVDGDLRPLRHFPRQQVSIDTAPHITWNSTNGFNVSVGDTLIIVRGHMCGEIGVVESIFPYESRVKLNIEGVGMHTTYIQFCTHLALYSMDRVQSFVGKTVWVIFGEKKGRRGTLRTLGRSKSTVALLEGLFDINNWQVTTETGLLLTGEQIPAPLLDSVNEMIRRSFIPGPARAVTPPPFPSSSTEPLESAWTTVEDHTPQNPPGPLPPNDYASAEPSSSWLLDDSFTPHYATHHICLKISSRFKTGSYSSRIARTLVPDRFRLSTGLAARGEIAVWVLGHNTGPKEFFFIPVSLVSPAPPKSKNQQCLVLRGALAGHISSFRSVSVNKKVATLTDGKMLPFSDICLVEVAS